MLLFSMVFSPIAVLLDIFYRERRVKLINMRELEGV